MTYLADIRRFTTHIRPRDDLELALAFHKRYVVRDETDFILHFKAWMPRFLQDHVTTTYSQIQISLSAAG